MMESLELAIYWFIWISSVSYAFISFIIDSKYLIELIDKKDLSEGWLLKRPIDVSDYEWIAIRETFVNNFKWIAIYLMLTQIIAKYRPKYLVHFFVIYSSFAITVVLNYKCLAIIWLNILISLVLQWFGKQLICYSLFVFVLYSVHNSPLFVNSKLGLNERQQFLFEVSMAWLNAKCLSLSIDRIRSRIHYSLDYHQLVQCAAYCLYLPAFFTGPIHLYHTFISDIETLEISWNKSRVISVTKELFRFVFWALTYELMMHLVYSSSIQFYPELSELLSGWSLCGFGFALPIMFYLKYFIIYGSVAAVAQHIEGFRMAPPPKCIGRIHSSSYLWRHFDRGLYLWLQCYFYRPIIGTKWNNYRKVLAGSVVFSCICLWHGMDKAVVVWSLLNFFGVAIEMIINSIYSWKIGNLSKNNLSDGNNLRVKALIAAPLFAVAFVSNLFFLSNFEVGYYFVQRILLSFPTPLVPTLLIMYCGCHVSLHCIRRESKAQTNLYT